MGFSFFLLLVGNWECLVGKMNTLVGILGHLVGKISSPYKKRSLADVVPHAL